MMPHARDGCDICAYELQGPVAAVAYLMVSPAVDRTSVKQGDLLTYFIRVQNLGLDTSPNVVNNLMSSGVTFVEARHNKGTHTAPPKGETGTVTWYLGDMLNQDNEVVEIELTAALLVHRAARPVHAAAGGCPVHAAAGGCPVHGSIRAPRRSWLTVLRRREQRVCMTSEWRASGGEAVVRAGHGTESRRCSR
jgi:uncharacterized repeat protein (TIGR01451 family)